MEATVAYTRPDGTVVRIPLVSMVGRRDGRVASQRVYMDLAPLFDPAAGDGSSTVQG